MSERNGQLKKRHVREQSVYTGPLLVDIVFFNGDFCGLEEAKLRRSFSGSKKSVGLAHGNSENSWRNSAVPFGS